MITLFVKTCSRELPCHCPDGSHAWKALPAGNEHMIPHDPGSAWRADAFIRQLRADRIASENRRKQSQED